ncbi:hypothetical protein SO802_002766 [Lithocarpus litseifolius]|uniref:Uncharacterized protein n=1 Tax=Lithocarpus litseifolius TaxID=425828 RepID=A0AAW2DY59_9ROSI
MINRLFRNNSTSSLASRSSSLPEIPQEAGIINSEEYELSDVDLKLGEWNLPKVPTKEFYKSSWNLKTVFKIDYHVRTIEQVYGINKEYETCYLFNPATIKAHKKKGHNFLHIGLVQFINGLPKLFGEKVKETLCKPLGVIDYDNLTYGDISSTIRSEGMKMCRDFKIQSQANKSKAKYEVGTFCTQYSLPPIAPSKRNTNFRRKESSEKPYRKRTAISKECRSKVKSLINTLVSDQTSKYEIFRLLELTHIKSESTSSSSDHEIHQLNQSSSSEPFKDLDFFSGPRIDLACRDSCCRNKTINTLSVLSKKDKLLVDLVEQIDDPVVKTQKLIQTNRDKCQFKPKDRTLSQDLDISEVQGGILINPKYPKSNSRYLSIIPFKTSQAKNPDTLNPTDDSIDPIQSPKSSCFNSCILHKDICCTTLPISKNVFSSIRVTENHSACPDNPKLETQQITHNPISQWKKAENKNKGKTPIQDYSQDKRLPEQSFAMHEGASSKGNQGGTTSLQELAQTAYSSKMHKGASSYQEAISL